MSTNTARRAQKSTDDKKPKIWNKNELGAAFEAEEIGELKKLLQHADPLRWFVTPAFQKKMVQVATVSRELQTAAAWQRPVSLPKPIGSALVPVTVTRTARSNSADGWLLPIMWVDGQISSGNERDGWQKLPASLIELGQKVVDAVRRSPSAAHHFTELEQLLAPGRWTLAFVKEENWQNVDLSMLELRADSAWAALSCALIARCNGFKFGDPLLATGCFEPEHGNWSVGIGSLEAKLNAAIAAGVNSIAVPHSSLAAAEQLVAELTRPVAGFAAADLPESPQVIALEDHQDIFLAVKPILQKMTQPPTGEDGDDAKNNWHQTLPTVADKREYYCRCLLPEVVQRNRARLGGVRQAQHVKHLVSIISWQWELLLLNMEVYQPENKLFFHTKGGMKNELDQMLNVCRGSQSEKIAAVEVRDSLAGNDGLRRMAEEVEKIVRKPGELVFDVMPGRRAMQMMLLPAARPGDLVHCWWVDTGGVANTVLPMSVKPMLWQIDDAGVLQPIEIGE